MDQYTEYLTTIWQVKFIVNKRIHGQKAPIPYEVDLIFGYILTHREKILAAQNIWRWRIRERRKHV